MSYFQCDLREHHNFPNENRKKHKMKKSKLIKTLASISVAGIIGVGVTATTLTSCGKEPVTPLVKILTADAT
jgi:hypothetical protein